jgi:hypothetical protein
MKILDCKQGSFEWFEARLGIPTASNFAHVLSKGKPRKTYMMKLIAEKLTGKITQNGNSASMDRGHMHEPRARTAYEFKKGRSVKQVGFILNEYVDAGSSPDGLVGRDGSIEVKSKSPHLHVEVMVNDKLPAEHKAQVQGGLWIAEREWCDFISYSPPLDMFVKRVYRDEKYISELEKAVIKFNDEMKELLERLKQ